MKLIANPLIPYKDEVKNIMKKLFNIGDKVKEFAGNKEGVIIGYSLRDKNWQERHNYEVEWTIKSLWGTKKVIKWELEPFI